MSRSGCPRLCDCGERATHLAGRLCKCAECIERIRHFLIGEGRGGYDSVVSLDDESQGLRPAGAR